MTWPTCHKTLRGDRFVTKGLFWVGPDQEGPGVQTTCSKISCKELSWPWKFEHNLTTCSEVILLCSVHLWTDRQMDRHTFWIPLDPLGKILFLNFYTLWSPAKFLPFTSWRILYNIFFSQRSSNVHLIDWRSKHLHLPLPAVLQLSSFDHVSGKHSV